MPLGIPFGVALNGDLSRWVTVACAHSLDSLRNVADPETFSRIQTLSDRLWDVSWGADGCTPLYMLPGLTRNGRSSEAPPGGGPDGSYNLASTLENRGDGITVPAVQANSTNARNTIQDALEIISDLYADIMPFCMSHEEHILTDFCDKDMNVFSIRRPRPGPTSVQCNVSSASRGGGLADFIGKLQGRWHADVHDHFARWTLLILQFRLPAGSDIGAFLLARPGLYVRHEVTDSDQVRLFLVFKGNDLHSGTAPTVDDSVKQQFLDDLAALYNNAGDQNRCVFMAYPNRTSVDRSVPVAATGATGLGNDSVLKDGQDATIHNYARDGRPSLGSTVSHMTRLLWEDHARSWNARVQYAACQTEFETRVHLIDGSIIEIPPPPLHPVHNFQYIKFMRASYKHLHLDNEEYYMRVDKKSYYAATDRILNLIDSDAHTGPTSDIGASVKDRSTVNPSSNPLVDAKAFTCAPRLPNNKRKRGLDSVLADDDTSEHGEPALAESSSPSEIEERPPRKSRRLAASTAAHQPTSTAAGASHAEPSTTLATPDTPNSDPENLNGQRVVHDEDEMNRDDTNNITDITSPAHNTVTDNNAKHDVNERDVDGDDEDVLSRVLSINDGVCIVRWRSFDDTWDSPLDEADVSAELLQEYRDSLNPDYREEAKRQLNDNSTCFKALCRLLDPINLGAQRLDLEKLVQQLQDRKRLATEQFLDFSALSEFPLHLQNTTKAVEDAEYVINDLLGVQILNTLQLACQMQGKTDDAIRELDAIQRALTHISCRSLVFIYHWQIDYSVRLGSDIFALPADILLIQFPSFAALAAAIRTFLLEEKTARHKTATFSPSPSILPAGLHFAAGDNPSLHIPNVASLKLRNSELDFQLKACISIFVNFIAMNSLADALKEVDSSSNVKSAVDGDIPAVYDQCLVRGAMLDSVLDAVDDDGIFCAPEIREVLHTPWLIISVSQRPSTFAKQLRKDPSLPLNNLLRWLRLHPSAAEIQSQSIRLGDAVRQCMLILGKVGLPKIAATHTRIGAVRKRQIIPLVGGPSCSAPLVEPLSGIFPRVEMPEFGCLGLILLEVAVFLRGSSSPTCSARVPDLQPVLSGLNPITNSKRRIVPDYFNPCRSRNDMHRLFATRLTGQQLTSRYGLSNMLLFIGTGQGGPTASFVNDHLQEWITSSDRCTQIFEAARTHFREEKAAKHSPSLFSNGNCWGAQFCSQLSLQDTAEGKEIDIRKHCEEFFSDKVFNEWKTFLDKASMWEESMDDIAERPSNRLPTFNDALALGAACGVDGFGANSLTNLQLANSLALMGLCQHPTVDEMGAQVFAIKKGGLGGLRLLGLHPAASQSKDSVIQAFRCVYAFMDEHLDAEHKDLFHFGPIFVEHFLCKLKRWASLFSKVGTLDKARLKGISSGHDFRQLGYILPLFVIDRLALHKTMLRL
ncbi:hypothetical protein BDZ89DRAFT_1127035 [Hymenopellis radicata]|nr:hypothetical protein BDZ89DRAFT_1127035 [Hymenopellis radicata]